ncbi:uncharacterized protein [Ptychodera flava]|uniref:uncharacterized protein n=1 Tax=Ptychodera flava TaxID=63121 RepID=UPI003969C5AC
MTSNMNKQNSSTTSSQLRSHSQHKKSTTVINLTQTKLTEHERNLLDKGLSFCPTPTKANKVQLAIDMNTFHRRLRLAEYFFDDETEDTTKYVNEPFRKKNLFTPPPNRDSFLEAFITLTKEDTEDHSIFRTMKDNLTKSERDALESLRKKRDWIIKPADKGSATVIMNRSDYILEADKILNNTKHYKRLKSDPTNKINISIKAAINDEYQQGNISKSTRDYLICNDPKPGTFYMLPKIHKEGIPFRPIISTINHPTQGISEYIDYHLQPLAAKLPSYIKDTTHFLQIIHNLEHIPPGSSMITFDVVSLYPSIPIEEGIQACRKALDRRSDKTPPTNTIIRFLKLVLYSNNFVFNNQHFLQIHGTAMGQKMAPSYAIIYMGDLEEKILQDAPSTPLLWHRFIDDIYSIFVANMQAITAFFKFLNSYHPTIKFTMEISKTSIPFLDVKVHVDDHAVRMFSEATLTGFKFNITINAAAAVNESSPRVEPRKRRAFIISDSNDDTPDLRLIRRNAFLFFKSD